MATSSSSASFISFTLLVILIVGTILVFRIVPPEIPLLYSQPWGQDQLAPKFALLILAGGAGGVVVIHMAVARFIARQDVLLHQLIAWSGALVLFFLALSMLTLFFRVGIHP